MAIVPLWSGREVVALRQARRMSVREFAGHLGVCDRMVSKWEAAGPAIRPRPLNQSALDTSLSMASADEKARFAQLTADPTGPPTPRRKTAATLPKGVRHLVRHPLDGKVMTRIEPGPLRPHKSRPIWLPAFYIDVEPVTKAEYAGFLVAKGRLATDWPEGDDNPRDSIRDSVSGVAWADASAYAQWASKTLPNVHQWERASQGTEGVAGYNVQEWCLSNDRAVQRGPKNAPAGGFRCVAVVADLLALLAI
jgi:Sulfatase-modifying factor enzyme 1